MNTVDTKLKEILMATWKEGFFMHEEAMPKLLIQMKHVFEAEMLEIIGENEDVDEVKSDILKAGLIRANIVREEQRNALKEKLGKEDNRQPIWDALNNSDA